MISLTLALILAILAPLIWASINILDKYVSTHKVKNPLSFTFLAGLVNLLAGILIALFINWNYPFSSLLAPAITGILFGTQYYFWYFIYKHEDASHLIGLIYLYPLVVALLSFIFIKEILSISSYFGLGFILIGVLVLSLRLKQIKLKASLWMIIMAIFNIPTGAIADIFGHKLSVFIGLVLQSLSFFLFFAYPNYLGILLGFFQPH